MDTQLAPYLPGTVRLSRGPSDLDHRIRKVWRGRLGFRFGVEIGDEYFESDNTLELQTLLDIHDASTLAGEVA